ncbi:MAG: hypothetical protein JSS86_20485 [Cyanobacteria bacterium SZAS LIN-2]|nr:hypothetical protein [Cyanobacteria bacterium SZAS LIN-2]
MARCGRAATRTSSSLDSMSAYRAALHVDEDSGADRLNLAAELLSGSGEVVVLNGRLALRPMGGRILCEVIDPTLGSKRPEPEYRAMVDAAQKILEASPLFSAVQSRELEWLVVADYGTGTVEMWRAV